MTALGSSHEGAGTSRSGAPFQRGGRASSTAIPATANEASEMYQTRDGSIPESSRYPKIGGPSPEAAIEIGRTMPRMAPRWARPK